VSDAVVELVFDPPWGQDMMSEEAKLRVRIFINKKIYKYVPSRISGPDEGRIDRQRI
jgi:metal-sulfur cluster biosynthetic enzyme